MQRKSCNVKRKPGSVGGAADLDDDSLVVDKAAAGAAAVAASGVTSASSLRSNHSMKRSTTCNLVFTAFLPGLNQTVQVISDAINCAQILGSPEVHKISSTRDATCGGSEVFVIGKNFTRDSKIVWDFFPQHRTVAQLMASEPHYSQCMKSESKSWIKETEPEAEFINQNHLIFRVPPLKTLTHDFDGNELFPGHSFLSPDAGQRGQHSLAPVTLRIRCGEKYSEPIVFTFVEAAQQQQQPQQNKQQQMQAEQMNVPFSFM